VHFIVLGLLRIGVREAAQPTPITEPLPAYPPLRRLLPASDRRARRARVHAARPQSDWIGNDGSGGNRLLPDVQALPRVSGSVIRASIIITRPETPNTVMALPKPW
jgi:hypothetical protein